MSKSFAEMSLDEQKAWWLEQATSALATMDMGDASIEWLAYTHNAVFAINHNQTPYVLKLSLAHDIQISSESYIREMLSSTGLAVPKTIRAIQTNYIQGLLLTYVDGTSPNTDSVTVEEMSAIGAFLAQLHQIKINTNLARHSLDWDGLFSKDGIYYPNDENMTVFRDEQLSVMDEVANKVKSVMAELGKSDAEFGIIHGDFLLKNILFHENEVHALDFEYCGWGYYLYDLTPILWQLKPQVRYPQLEQALWDGYTGIRPLTARHRDLLETLIAGRQVASMRWIAANQQNPYVVEKVEAILAQRTAQLSAFLETGILKRD